VAFLDHEFEQERRAGLRGADRLLDPSDDVGGLLDPPRGDVDRVVACWCIVLSNYSLQQGGPRRSQANVLRGTRCEVPMDRIANWIKYQNETANHLTRVLLLQAVYHVTERQSALELGAGALVECDYLLRAGFRNVVAVDITPQFKTINVPPGATFDYHERQFAEYPFPTAAFNLISAQYAMPFCFGGSFDAVWQRIHQALKTDGIFTGQLFGEADGWRDDPNIVFHTKAEVAKLFDAYEVLKIDECKYTEDSKRGKFWHYFDLIAKKRTQE
jgi:tellurite methyltransferase